MSNKKLDKIKENHKMCADVVNIPHVYSDIDDTLVMWPDDPFIESENSIPIEFMDKTYHLIPHKRNIEQIKRLKRNGFKVIAWSLGGENWANTVVDALAIREYIDFVHSKPEFIIDDLEPEHWMGKNIYQKFHE